MEITLFSCLRADITAATDIERKHGEVKAKFGRTEDQVRCKHCEAVSKYNMTTTPMTYDLSNVT